MKAKLNPFVVYLFWILATMVGWLAGVFNLGATAKTYLDIVRLLPIYLVDGLLIGLVVGLGQALVLRRFTDLASKWVLATTIGYVLTFGMGLIVSVLIPSIVWMLKGESLLPFTKPSTTDIWITIHDLFWGGMLIGAIQWPVLKKIIPNSSHSKGILWVLVTWFVFGTSIFVGAFTHGSFLATFQMGILGSVMGLSTGLILLAFLSNSKILGQSTTYQNNPV